MKPIPYGKHEINKDAAAAGATASAATPVLPLFLPWFEHVQQQKQQLHQQHLC